mmetsp:Transcript_58589/g.189802  ORF Transcript_58589/g.189802 Transcript_58589/m.189802 type:complete len:468 (+) Transcript_58589:40-1443(+)
MAAEKVEKNGKCDVAVELISAITSAGGSRQVVAAAVAALWRLETGSESEPQEGQLHQRLRAVHCEMAARDVIGEMAGMQLSHPAAARQQLFALAKEYDGVRRCRNFAVHGNGRGRGRRLSTATDQQAAAQEEAVASTTSAGTATASGASSCDELAPALATGPWVHNGCQHGCQGKGKGTSASFGKVQGEKYYGKENKELQDELFENMEVTTTTATAAAPARAIATGGGAVAAPTAEIKESVPAQVTAAEGAAAVGQTAQGCTGMETDEPGHELDENTEVASSAAPARAMGTDPIAEIEEFVPKNWVTKLTAAGGAAEVEEMHGQDPLLSRVERRLEQATTQEARNDVWAEVAGEAAQAKRLLLEGGPGCEGEVAEESAARFFSRFDALLRQASAEEVSLMWGLVDEFEEKANRLKETCEVLEVTARRQPPRSKKSGTGVGRSRPPQAYGSHLGRPPPRGGGAGAEDG